MIITLEKQFVVDTYLNLKNKKFKQHFHVNLYGTPQLDIYLLDNICFLVNQLVKNEISFYDCDDYMIL